MKSLKLWRMVLVAGAAVLLVVGCGGDDDDNGGNGGNGGDASVRQGTWTVKSTTSVLGSAAPCQGIPPEVVTEDEQICDDSDLTGGEDTSGCEIDISGNTVAIDCTQSTSVGPCTLQIVIDGNGTFTDTSYDITIDVTTTATGTDPSCALLNNPCTTRIRQQGTFKNTTGCSGKPADLRRAVASGIDLAVSRIR